MTDNDPAFLARARQITDELFRVLCDEPSMRQSGALEPVLLPFAGRSDALEFLRTVPSGTSRVELERSAVARLVSASPPHSGALRS